MRYFLNNFIAISTLVFICYLIISCDNPIRNEESQIYEILFVSDRSRNNQIYLMDMYGSNVRRLTHDSLDYYHPQFSPDDSKILFYSKEEGDGEIYIMDTDGDNLINLSNSIGNDMVPQFSPVGNKIVFTSDRDGNKEIYIMNNDGTEQTRLTNNSYTDHSPQFSPDGNEIVFYSIMTEETYDIFKIKSDGSNLECLTKEKQHFTLQSFIPDYSYNAFDVTPRFSPDGLNIVFVPYFRGHGFDIFLMDADGNNQKRITDVAGYNIAPFFTPDGKKIIFRTHREYNYDIYIMNRDGSNQINLTPGSNHAYFSDISPDASKILIYDNLEVPYKYYKIYLMDRNGQNKIMLSGDNLYYNDFFPKFRAKV